MMNIREAIARHAGVGLTPTSLPGLSVLSRTHTTGPLCDVLEPTCVLVAGGVKDTALYGKTYRYGAGEYLVTSVDLPVVGSVIAGDEDEPFMAVVFRLQPDRIASLLLETNLARAGSLDRMSQAALGVGQASPELLDAFARLFTLLDQPANIAALAPGIEREILWRLLTGPQATAIRQIGIADSYHAHLTRAIRWIRAHYDEPLRTAELAAIASMSVSSFHRHFRAVTSMTPLQYQKQLRLHEAHLRLLTGELEISSVGFSVGYLSPSQFSREYRRLFGTSPSQATAA